MSEWLFGLLLRRRDREMILGDLVEERALLAANLPAGEVARWYRSQMLRSIPPVMWANLRRGLWLKTLGASLAAYLVVAVLIWASEIALPMLRMRPALYPFASLLVGFLVMALGGYVAASIRPGAAAALAAFTGVMGVLSMAMPGPHAPFWYECTLVIIGPSASLAGGRIRLRRKERS